MTGVSKAMMYIGRVVVSGEEGVRMGLANKCVPDDELMRATINMTRGFLANSRFTLHADKMLVN